MTAAAPPAGYPGREARPALSVVIPSRNTRDLTLACLASLAAAAARARAAEGDLGDRTLADPVGPADLADLDVVLVDDAGGDGTAEVVAERYPTVRVLRLDRQAGFTRAANHGLAAARGEVLLLLNSDTEVGGDALTALRTCFAAAPRLGVAGARLRYADGTPQWSGGGEPGALWLFALASGLPHLAARLPLYRRWRPPSGIRRERRERGGRSGGGKRGEHGEHGGIGSDDGAGSGSTGGGTAGSGGMGSGSAGGGGAECSDAGTWSVDWVTGAAMAIRRAAWEAAGPFDERFRFYGQDLDLCVRARDAGWEVAVLGGLEVVHHHGSTIASEGGRRRSAGPGAGAGGGGAQHLELLWTDLVRWAGKRGGASAARRAAVALRAGGALRRLGRGLAAPLVPAVRRAAFRAEGDALAAALAALPGALAEMAEMAEG